MRWGRVVAVAAFWVGCGVSQATTGVLISGSGTFGDDVTPTAVTAVGKSFSFSFTEADPVTLTNPFGAGGSATHDSGHGYVLDGAGQFSFSIDGKAVEINGNPLAKYLSQVTFFDDNFGGGFDLDFSLPNNLAVTLTVYTNDATGLGVGLLCDPDNDEDQACTPGAFKLTGKGGLSVNTAANDEAATGTGTLSVAAITITPPPESAVPEPAAWMMMVSGFGLVGAAVRRRRNLMIA